MFPFPFVHLSNIHMKFLTFTIKLAIKSQKTQANTDLGERSVTPRTPNQARSETIELHKN